jgi:CheY-like chemotaxis protein
MPTKRHILIIDDDHDLRVLQRSVLEQMNYKVSTVTNGKDAIESLERFSTLPELIILDIQMPIMNGNDFLIYKNQNPALKKIPTLIIASNIEDCIEHELIQKLQKPVDLSDFISKVNDCLKNNL